MNTIRPATNMPDSPGDERAAAPMAARLVVDLAALAGNYRTIARTATGETAAVVKADGYGLGVAGIAHTLYESGCRTYFTAFAQEAVDLRRILNDVDIFVLMPQVGRDARALLAHRLIPCLFDLDGADRWIAAAAANGAPASAALHVDTGIHRLGLDRGEFDTLLGDESRRSRLDLRLLMSHLACAEDREGPANRRQLERFREMRSALPNLPASLANSAGTFLGPDFHFDLVRPGISLYGHDPFYRHRPPRVRAVAAFEARIGQIADVGPGESVGYGGMAICDVPRRIAVVQAGYADGIPCNLFRPGARFEVAVAGYAAPLFGRVSMDMTTIDVSELPEDTVRPGAWVEVFGPNAPVERVAEQAGTIPYEVLTRVGTRVERAYR